MRLVKKEEASNDEPVNVDDIVGQKLRLEAESRPLTYMGSPLN